VQKRSPSVTYFDRANCRIQEFAKRWVAINRADAPDRKYVTLEKNSFLLQQFCLHLFTIIVIC
jgi:hypothetical protein